MSMIFLSKSVGRRGVESALTGSASLAFADPSTTIGSAATPAPTGLFVDTTTSTSVTLDWDDSTQVDHLTYDVQYDTNMSFSSPTMVNSIVGSTHEVTGLTTDQLYYFRVRDVTSTATGDWSDFVTGVPASLSVLTGIFVDGVGGNDSWNGQAAQFVSGTTGPKATISAGISACSIGDSLYLKNDQTYAFGTWDLDWNAGASAGQAAELAGYYIDAGVAYRWNALSGEARPIFAGRFRTTNDHFTVRGLNWQNNTWMLRAITTGVSNFTLRDLAVTRNIQAFNGIPFQFGGTGKGYWVLDSTFIWGDGLDYSGGTDMIEFGTYCDYIEVADCIFNRAEHDVLSIAGSDYWVHHNVFSNVNEDGVEGYRPCAFFARRDPVGSADGGEPYGAGLVENNTFYGSNSPSGSEYTPPICKMQTKYGIFRFNEFNHNSTGTYPAIPHDLWQMQTCCGEDVETAPLVANQRLYNNTITVTGSSARRWIRQGTTATDGTDPTYGNENTRTEQHDNWVFNNHFQGALNSSGENMFDFSGIHPNYRLTNALSRNKVEYNSFSDSTTTNFLSDGVNGQQTLAQAESNWPGYVNNNTVNSSGGAGLGRNLATTIGSGTSTTLPVSDAGAFQSRIYDVDTGEIYAGDTITVNSQTATVLSRDLGANTLGLSASVTWTAGQAVNLDGALAGYTGLPVSDPLSLPLVQSTDQIFSYQGTFTLPSQVQNDGVAGGGMAISEDGTQMYLVSFFGNTLKCSIPAVGGNSSLTFDWRSAPGTPSGSLAGQVQGATLEYNGEFYRTKYIEYNAAVDYGPEWIQKGNLNAQSMTGLFDIGGAGAGRARALAQGFMHIPSEWQGLLGGPVAALGSRVSIISASQNGYGFAVFDPADVGSGSVPVTPLVDYTYANPLEPGDSVYPGWGSYPKNANGGTDYFSSTNAPHAGAFIVPGSRSLLFVTSHGYGVADNGCRPGSSVHNDPNRVQVVAYDLQDLVDVKNGLTNAYDVQPYDWWEWSSAYGASGVHWSNCVGSYPMIGGWGTYDPTNGRWYMSADMFSQDMYVWDVNGL